MYFPLTAAVTNSGKLKLNSVFSAAHIPVT